MIDIESLGQFHDRRQRIVSGQQAARATRARYDAVPRPRLVERFRQEKPRRAADPGRPAAGGPAETTLLVQALPAARSALRLAEPRRADNEAECRFLRTICWRRRRGSYRAIRRSRSSWTTWRARGAGRGNPARLADELTDPQLIVLDDYHSAGAGRDPPRQMQTLAEAEAGHLRLVLARTSRRPAHAARAAACARSAGGDYSAWLTCVSPRTSRARSLQSRHRTPPQRG